LSLAEIDGKRQYGGSMTSRSGLEKGRTEREGTMVSKEKRYNPQQEIILLITIRSTRFPKGKGERYKSERKGGRKPSRY